MCPPPSPPSNFLYATQHGAPAYSSVMGRESQVDGEGQGALPHKPKQASWEESPMWKKERGFCPEHCSRKAGCCEARRGSHLRQQNGKEAKLTHRPHRSGLVQILFTSSAQAGEPPPKFNWYKGLLGVFPHYAPTFWAGLRCAN